MSKFCLLFLGVLVIAWGQHQETSEPWNETLAENLYIKPYLQNVTQTSIVLMWETKTPVVGKVYYGTDISLGQVTIEKHATKLHEIHLTGLRPGQVYFYQVSYQDTTLPRSFFKTAPPDGTRKCRIVMYGDARSNPLVHRKNIEQMIKFNPDIIVHTGDIVARGTEYPQWQRQHFWPIQIISEQIPMFACLGNHEKNSSLHFDYLSMPHNEIYYSFDYANVHIVCLDSNSDYTPFGPDSPQYRWLISDLEKNQHKEWLFVVFHHPLFRCHPTRGIEDQRFDWHPVFEKYGVDYVFTGHDHYYFRTRPIGKTTPELQPGVRYLTTAGGGAPLYPVRKRVYGAVEKSLHHITIIDIENDHMRGQAIDVEGNVIDTFAMPEAYSEDNYIAYEMFEFEREFRTQIQKIPVVEVRNNTDVKINSKLEVATNFEVRVEGELVWQEDTAWKFAQSRIPFAVNPGAILEIPIEATVAAENIYPVPQMEIHLQKFVARSKQIRNNVWKCQPIRVRTHKPITAQKYSQEPVWLNLITSQGNAQSTDTKLSISYDAANLYILAEMKAPATSLEKARNQRDHRKIPQDEHIGVVLASPDNTYAFAVNTKNIQFDANEKGSDWNYSWESSVQKTPEGWQAKISIPLKLIDTKKSWKIGFQRNNEATEIMSVLCPSFTMTDMENYLPQYEHDWQDQSSLLPLLWE